MKDIRDHEEYRSTFPLGTLLTGGLLGILVSVCDNRKAIDFGRKTEAGDGLADRVFGWMHVDFLPGLLAHVEWPDVLDVVGGFGAFYGGLTRRLDRAFVSYVASVLPEMSYLLFREGYDLGDFSAEALRDGAVSAVLFGAGYVASRFLEWRRYGKS